MILIGLAGLKRAGKSTVARYLTEQYGFMEVSFAAPLKRGLATMLGIDIQDLEDERLKETVIPWLGKSPRQCLQSLGTEWGRKLVAEDLWLRLAARSIERHHRMGAPGVIVSDVRFDNEAEFILARRGELWRIWRNRTSPVLVDPHASEAGISASYPSRGILNVGSFADLYRRVDELLAPHGAATT